MSASLGAGHDGAAHEIARRLRAAGHEVHCHDFLDLLPGHLGNRVKETYRKQLAVAPGSWEWLLGAIQRDGLMNAITLRAASASARKLRAAIGDADAVVSTYPLVGQVIMRLRRRGKLDIPLITYLTDPSVHPLWIAEGTDLYLAAHPEIAAQVRLLGGQRVAVVGPAVRPDFRPVATEAERDAARAQFGLPADKPLALVVSGSWAVGEIEKSAREVSAGGVVTPVVVCGENTALRERLHDLDPGIVLGWVDDMPALLRACDVVVLNSGGLTFFEAHATRVPVLTYRCLAGHGRTNARSLESAGLARWLHDPDELTEALAKATSARPVGRTTMRPARIGTACPTVAIAGMLRQPPEPVRRGMDRVRRRRIIAWAMAFAWLVWACTNGTSIAVANGWRDGAPHTPSGSVYVVVDTPSAGTFSSADLRAMAGLRVSAAVSVSTAMHNPDIVRQLAATRIPVVSSAGGQPYETGVFIGRGAIGAAARAISRLTTHEPNLLLSNGDLDAVDVGLAALYGERIVIPKTTVNCASLNLPTRGGVMLVDARGGQDCTVADLLQRVEQQIRAHNLKPAPLQLGTIS
ncbi:MAG TPA: glycosyltransferase [Pseudonocardiaceae bacterium]|nr:glycosyltransferase [Pseudonocardiaceae bacterium]